MRFAVANVVKKIDSYCIEELKIPGILLMENAALKVIDNIDFNNNSDFCVVCSKGNNGGDGLAVARHIFLKGKKVDVFIVGSEEGMTEESTINYNILKKLNIKITVIKTKEQLEKLVNSLKKSDVVIDAILGIGISKNIQGVYRDVINEINLNSKYILSIDVPSGFECNVGKPMGTSIKANKTVSFQLLKKGFLNYGSEEYTGELIVEDIGIPSFVIERYCDEEFTIEKSFVKSRLFKRDKYSHKGDYGKVLVLAGSEGFTGAAYIATQAAIRSGAGLVTLSCPKNIQAILSEKLVEGMTVPSEEKELLVNYIKKSTAIALGPGMGNNEKTLNLLKLVIENANCTLILDADGINVLKDNFNIINDYKREIIMTPHVGEFSRLTGLTTEYINENRLEVAKEFASKNNIILVLKGYNTIITDGKRTVVNTTGNSSMASGGMGDALTGIITAFVAQGYPAFEAAVIGTYIHGYCGDKLSRNMECVNASHILEELPFVIKEIAKN